MSNSIPKSVNICGHEYQVRWVKQKKLIKGAGAEVEYPARIISIEDSYKKDKKTAWLFFLHEVRHAWQFETGAIQILDEQACELDADGFASFITSLQAQGIL